MFEPLLLANPDMNTLRHQCSRASTNAYGSAQPHAHFMLHFPLDEQRGLRGLRAA